MGAKQRKQSLGILNSSGVLGAAAPKGLGRSPYKICELDLSSLKASKNLEFLRINLEFLEIASLHPSMTKILEFHIEILGSSPRMTKKVKSGDDTRLREF